MAHQVRWCDDSNNKSSAPQSCCCTCYYIWVFSTHVSSPKATKWIILTFNLMTLWKISSLIFSPIFEKVIVCSTNYIANIDRKMEKSIRWEYKNRSIFCGSLKGFDTLNHRFFQTKLQAYGLQPAALNLIGHS